MTGFDVSCVNGAFHNNKLLTFLSAIVLFPECSEKILPRSNEKHNSPLNDNEMPFSVKILSSCAAGKLERIPDDTHFPLLNEEVGNQAARREKGHTAPLKWTQDSFHLALFLMEQTWIHQERAGGAWR